MGKRYYNKKNEYNFIYNIGLLAKRSWIGKTTENNTTEFYDSITNKLLGYETKNGNYVLIIPEFISLRELQREARYM